MYTYVSVRLPIISASSFPVTHPLNSLPNDKLLASSQLKAFEDDKIKVTKISFIIIDHLDG